MYALLRCAHHFADMRHNGAVYDILDYLGLQLFKHLSNPAITVAQVRLALSRFQVCPDDRQFVAIYDSAQRRFVTGPPVIASITGTKRVAPFTNSDAAEYNEEATGQHLRRPCFNFFSAQGCSSEACRFSHGALSEENKAKVLSALAIKGLSPDADKI